MQATEVSLAEAGFDAAAKLIVRAGGVCFETFQYWKQEILDQFKPKLIGGEVDQQWLAKFLYRFSTAIAQEGDFQATVVEMPLRQGYGGSRVNERYTCIEISSPMGNKAHVLLFHDRQQPLSFVNHPFFM